MPNGIITAHNLTPTVITVTGALVADTYYVCTASGATTQTLPAATGTGKVIVLENTGTGTISLARAGSDTINGATSATVVPYGRVTIRDIGAGVWLLSAALDYYETYDGGTAACTGAITSNGSWKLARVGPVVTVKAQTVTASSSSATSFTLGSVLPARFRPLLNTIIPIQVMKNGIYVIGACLVTASTGTLTCYAGIDCTTLYSGTCGLDYPQTVSWLVI